MAVCLLFIRVKWDQLCSPWKAVSIISTPWISAGLGPSFLLTAEVQPEGSSKTQRWLFVSFLPELLPLIPHQAILRPWRNYESWRPLSSDQSSFLHCNFKRSFQFRASLRSFDACCLPVSYTLCLPCQVLAILSTTKLKILWQLCIMTPTHISSGERETREESTVMFLAPAQWTNKYRNPLK